MRFTASFALLASLALVACGEVKDPLDGVTAAVTTNAGSNSDGMSSASTDDPTGSGGTEGGGTDGSSDSATSTGGPGTSVTITSATTEPGTSATTNPGTSATTDATSSSTSATTGDPGDPYEAARQLCVDTINMYRSTLGLPPYARWTDAEKCSDDEAASDGQSGTPHGAFGMCGEFAQNECPGWPSPPEQSLPGCLEQMWAEGPGEDFNLHGHYINMSSEQYTRVACGFADAGGGEMWMVQNFQ